MPSRGSLTCGRAARAAIARARGIVLTQNERDVVLGGDALAEALERRDQSVAKLQQSRTIAKRLAGDRVAQAAIAEQLSGAVRALDHTVGEADEQIARAQL